MDKPQYNPSIDSVTITNGILNTHLIFFELALQISDHVAPILIPSTIN